VLPGLALELFQLMAPRLGKLVPRVGDLLELLAIGGRRDTGHIATLGRVLTVFLNFLQEMLLPRNA